MSVNSSASVSYTGSAGKALKLEEVTTTTVALASDESLVAVYPTSALPRVTAVTGRIARTAGTNVPKDVRETLAFQGSATASPSYPPTGTPTILSKTFFASANPTVAYDATNEQFTLTEAAYGVITVEYTAYGNRLVVKHSGCTAETDENYQDVFLVAEATGYATASLLVVGGACGANNINVSGRAPSRHEDAGLVIEVSPEVPIDFYPLNSDKERYVMTAAIAPIHIEIEGETFGMRVGCRIRVFPNTAVDLQGVNCRLSPTFVGQGSKEVRQALAFSDSYNTSLSYIPENGVVFAPASASALTAFDEYEAVKFVGPGTRITEVTWISPTAFILGGIRTLRTSEVAVLRTTGSETVNCYTFTEAQYSASYREYEVGFVWDATIGWFAPALVMAKSTNGKDMGTIQLMPPSRGGVI